MNASDAAFRRDGERYCLRRPLPYPWQLAGDAGGGLAGAVIIPALAESAELFATLATLAANPAAELEQVLVVVVVNHRAEAAPAMQADNRATLARLAGLAVATPLRLAWVDAAAPGRELPAGEGVGLARKIGCDLALPRLANGDAFLAQLDADTQVEPGYLAALRHHFAGAATGAATLPYRHRPAATAAKEAAITRYELYLRHDLLGLTLAGSPYAYTSLGSAIACTARAYLAAGGMNRRLAGEDFYLLQQLAKVAGVAPLAGTTVHPSARVSGRTPFGTGASVARLLAGDEDLPVLPWAAYAVLKRWLELVPRSMACDGATLVSAAGELAPALAELLDEKDFVAVWERLRRQHRTPAALQRAVSGWFDALATRRLLHRLLPGVPLLLEEAVPELLVRAGLSPAGGATEWLARLRRCQGA